MQSLSRGSSSLQTEPWSRGCAHRTLGDCPIHLCHAFFSCIDQTENLPPRELTAGRADETQDCAGGTHNAFPTVQPGKNFRQVARWVGGIVGTASSHNEDRRDAEGCGVMPEDGDSCCRTARCQAGPRRAPQGPRHQARDKGFKSLCYLCCAVTARRRISL